MCLFSGYLRAISAAETTLQKVLKLTANHLFAHRRYTVDEHCTLQMVELVLHHASQVTFHPFVVFYEVLVLIAYMYACRTLHILVYSGQREASLLHRLLLRILIVLKDVRIDVCVSETLVLWIVLAEYININNNNANIQTNLWSSKTDAVACVHCFKHISYQCLQFGIVGCDVLSLFT